MLYLLYRLHTEIPAFNVFRYITFRTIYAALAALALALLVGPSMIRTLQKYQIGQQIREEGPKSHQGKRGTPTMGGVLILVAVIGSTLLLADLTNAYVWLALLSLVGFGAVGFYDDYLKIIKKRSEGLRPRTKLGLQVLIALAVALILYKLPAYSTQLSVPFFKKLHPNLGVFYVPFVVFVIVGASNAVNLTDGLDGLAVGPVIVTAIAYTVVSYVAGHAKIAEYLLITHIEGAGELAVFCAAMFGASLGFLWFNAYPASVFMGDVGSLALGGALGTVAVISKHELLLAVVGGLFVVEAVSVIFQVGSYKWRRKRVFLMAPIHHHYELKGWEEPKIVVRFWIITVILALISLSTLKLR